MSVFYLHHRLSEDLDFFNENEEVNLQVITRILGKFKKEIKITKIEQRSIFGIHNFFFHFPDKDVLKIDCEKSDKHVFLKNGDEEEFYVRSGPSSAKLSGRALIDYIKNNFGGL